MLSAPLDGAVCGACWRSVRDHAAPHIEWRGFDGPLDLLCAIGEYDGRLREIIHALKYDHRRSISRPLGSLMRECGVDLLRGADVAVPVPLHPSRERARGFNQADDLALQLGLPVQRLLRRTIATKSQIDLPAGERIRNVRNAFELAGLPAGFFSAPRRVFGQPPGGSFGSPPAVVALVDDVTTTSATLVSCARVLKAAGVREVRGITAARVSSARR